MPEYSIAKWNILQVVVGQSLFEQRVMNVLHYQYTGDQVINDGPAEVNRILGVLTTGINSVVELMKACQSDSLKYSFIRGQVVYPTRKHFLNLILTGEGDEATESMPPNVAAVVSKQTTGVGRGRTGRMSVGGIPRIWVQGGALTGAGITPLDNLGRAIDDPIAKDALPRAWEPCVLPTGNFQEAPWITSCFVQPTIRVLRRRTVGQGI